jgi:hypothetical protein
VNTFNSHLFAFLAGALLILAIWHGQQRYSGLAILFGMLSGLCVGLAYLTAAEQ